MFPSFQLKILPEYSLVVSKILPYLAQKACPLSSLSPSNHSRPSGVNHISDYEKSLIFTDEGKENYSFNTDYLLSVLNQLVPFFQP